MIRTYVIFDVESTGLPERCYQETKITELSLVAVLTEHLHENLFGHLPRVLNRLTLLFHPGKFISSGSEKTTGLMNEQLENLPTFDDNACHLIENFIMHLPQPVCLVAHNGYNYDYRLLQAHMKKCGKELPRNVLCSDSLTAFRALKVYGNAHRSNIQEYLTDSDDEWFESSSLEIKNEMDKIEKDYYASDLEAHLTHLINNEKKEDEIDLTFNAVRNSTNVIDLTRDTSITVIDSTNALPIHVVDLTDVYDKTPVKTIKQQQINVKTTKTYQSVSFSKSSVVRKQLFGPSYSLENVYRHLMNKSIPDAHRAEADCYALLRCIMCLAERFKEHVEQNHKHLYEIRNMW